MGEPSSIIPESVIPAFIAGTHRAANAMFELVAASVPATTGLLSDLTLASSTCLPGVRRLGRTSGIASFAAVADRRPRAGRDPGTQLRFGRESKRGSCFSMIQTQYAELRNREVARVTTP